MFKIKHLYHTPISIQTFSWCYTTEPKKESKIDEKLTIPQLIEVATLKNNTLYKPPPCFIKISLITLRSCDRTRQSINVHLCKVVSRLIQILNLFELSGSKNGTLHSNHVCYCQSRDAVKKNNIQISESSIGYGSRCLAECSFQQNQGELEIVVTIKII